MKDIEKYLKETVNIQTLLSEINSELPQLVAGLSGSGRNLLTNILFEELQKTIVVLTPNLLQATQVYEDISQMAPEIPLYIFPVEESVAAELAFSSPEYRSQRVETLDFLNSGKKGIVVIPAAGFKKILSPASIWETHCLDFSVGMELDMDSLPEKLVAMGYSRERMVASPGEFSIRGGIIDIYALNEENPLRMELFDTEIDTLRYFDAYTQKSVDSIETVRILPAQDTIFTKAEIVKQASAVEKKAEKAIKGIKNQEVKESMTRVFSELTDNMKRGELSKDPQLYTSLVYPEQPTILDYISEDALLIVDDYSRILEVERTIESESSEWKMSKVSEGVCLPSQDFSADIREVIKKSKQHRIYYALFHRGFGNMRFHGVYPFQYRTLNNFFSQMPQVKLEMERWLKQHMTVFVMVPSFERAEKVQRIFADFGVHSYIKGNDPFIENKVNILVGGMANGFELPQEKVVFVTEKELFNKVTKKQPHRQKMTNAERLKSYTELNPGDYVVHVNHGIGLYTGMETIEVGGVHQDYMSIAYQEGAKLFIPVTQIHLIQKYVSSDAKTPKMHKLGGTEWAKTKKKVASKIEDIADELIELYANRESEKGYAYQPDTPEQLEFENAFPYTETDDQLRSTAEIKADMESIKPMDRLLVGDVGYGKTEVAMRAIFKAVQEGKQAAFLVPTTILAQQHYESLTQRFEEYPFEIGLLSRFRTKKQQDETLAGIRKGTVDIVIGTHRILSKDVVFADLGLLVVDEEQRFGVKHKERLKQLKASVDVLTLTATPIPRTLHMSMLGVRDLSVIETPPANRYPVQTYVMEQNNGAVRDAIERELARGGQAFYLYNRVETIEKKAQEIRELVPDVRVAVAHGQMTEVQLENVIMDFIEGRYDVLVTTTIIETGVDIPNVNTLFIENADRMGLSQLYQLRGRVGRTNRIAYAYLMYQPNKMLTEVSEKRLQAIKEFTELGAGFKIAMRDLSIRGAGNLLGAQQHGFIDSVGFDLYSEMLGEAVAAKRGLKAKSKRSIVEIDLSIDAYIPADYIEDERQKIDFYKRIQRIESVADHDEIDADLIDRFGDYPQEVSDLLEVGLIKNYAEKSQIETIKRQGETVVITFSQEATVRLQGPAVFEALSNIPLKAQINLNNAKLVVSVVIGKLPNRQWLNHLNAFIKACVAETDGTDGK